MHAQQASVLIYEVVHALLLLGSAAARLVDILVLGTQRLEPALHTCDVENEVGRDKSQYSTSLAAAARREDVQEG